MERTVGAKNSLTRRAIYDLVQRTMGVDNYFREIGLRGKADYDENGWYFEYPDTKEKRYCNILEIEPDFEAFFREI
jgi:hypothetical protein